MKVVENVRRIRCISLKVTVEGETGGRGQHFVARKIDGHGDVGRERRVQNIRLTTLNEARETSDTELSLARGGRVILVVRLRQAINARLRSHNLRVTEHRVSTVLGQLVPRVKKGVGEVHALTDTDTAGRDLNAVNQGFNLCRQAGTGTGRGGIEVKSEGLHVQQAVAGQREPDNFVYGDAVRRVSGLKTEKCSC